MKNKKEKRLHEWLYFGLQMLALALAIFIVNHLVLSFAVVHGKSMEPTLADRDVLICVKLGYRPQRGDIVLCRTGKGYENELVKRIIGLPGDRIEIDSAEGTVYVNGKPLDETYCKNPTYSVGDIMYPAVVPENQYFVLGDNREVSVDSRYSEIGMVSENKIDGHIVLRLFPFTEFGKVN